MAELAAAHEPVDLNRRGFRLREAPRRRCHTVTARFLAPWLSGTNRAAGARLQRVARSASSCRSRLVRFVRCVVVNVRPSRFLASNGSATTS